MTFWHGARLVLVSIGLVVVVSFVGVVAATMFMSREPTIGQNSVLVLGLHGDLAEVGPRGLARLVESPPTLRSLVNNLRKAKVDSRIKSVVIMPAGLDAFWGKY